MKKLLLSIIAIFLLGMPREIKGEVLEVTSNLVISSDLDVQHIWVHEGGHLQVEGSLTSRGQGIYVVEGVLEVDGALLHEELQIEVRSGGQLVIKSGIEASSGSIVVYGDESRLEIINGQVAMGIGKIHVVDGGVFVVNYLGQQPAIYFEEGRIVFNRPGLFDIKSSEGQAIFNEQLDSEVEFVNVDLKAWSILVDEGTLSEWSNVSFTGSSRGLTDVEGTPFALFAYGRIFGSWGKTAIEEERLDRREAPVVVEVRLTDESGEKIVDSTSVFMVNGVEQQLVDGVLRFEGEASGVYQVLEVKSADGFKHTLGPVMLHIDEASRIEVWNLDRNMYEEDGVFWFAWVKAEEEVFDFDPLWIGGGLVVIGGVVVLKRRFSRFFTEWK